MPSDGRAPPRPCPALTNGPGGRRRGRRTTGHAGGGVGDGDTPLSNPTLDAGPAPPPPGPNRGPGRAAEAADPPDEVVDFASPAPRNSTGAPNLFAPDTTRISPMLGTPLAHATSGYCSPTEGDCALPSRGRSRRRMRRHPCDDDTSDSPPLANWPSPPPRPARWPPTADKPWQRGTPAGTSRQCHRLSAGRRFPRAHPCASASSDVMTSHTTRWVPSSAGASARTRNRPTGGRRRPLARHYVAPPETHPNHPHRPSPRPPLSGGTRSVACGWKTLRRTRPRQASTRHTRAPRTPSH